jgi:2-amino-4-hydroxy-6-hydroxymethyldihydropteridine diphosphokinase
MNGVYIIIGGNLGDRAFYLSLCRQCIEVQIGNIINHSSTYETAAWGKTNVPKYLNQVLRVDTNLNALNLLSQCLEIEKTMGRIRSEKWDSRVIDIDILFFNNEIIATDQLTIPHPYLHERKFVLIPLNELIPDYIHPILKKTVTELLQLSSDLLLVEKIKL